MARRAVLYVSMELIHDLLHLPEGVEVLSVCIDLPRDALGVIVANDELPESGHGPRLPELSPTYGRSADGQITLLSLGIPGQPE